MKNKYLTKWGELKILPFERDLIEAIRNNDDVTIFETLLTDAYVKECICADEIYRILLTMIRLASGNYSVDDLIHKLPKMKKRKKSEE